MNELVARITQVRDNIIEAACWEALRSKTPAAVLVCEPDAIVAWDGSTSSDTLTAVSSFDVRVVAADAARHLADLTIVYYRGTYEQWEARV